MSTTSPGDFVSAQFLTKRIRSDDLEIDIVKSAKFCHMAEMPPVARTTTLQSSKSNRRQKRHARQAFRSWFYLSQLS
jgi:hypothetical protein